MPKEHERQIIEAIQRGCKTYRDPEQIALAIQGFACENTKEDGWSVIVATGYVGTNLCTHEGYNFACEYLNLAIHVFK